MKQTYIIRDDNIRNNAIEFIRRLPVDPIWKGVFSEVKSIRSLEQNDKMWAMLTDLSKQINWYGNHLTKEEWKDVMSAGLKKQRAVPGIDGGFVIIGAHTSKMSIKDMIDMIDLIYSFGIEHNVKWSEPNENIRT